MTERYFHEETFSLLGFLAASTRHIELGLGVTNPYTRHPALLGMACATLDRISGGRFLLGLGRSEKWVIEGRMGIPYRRPLAHMESFLPLLRRLVAGERVNSVEDERKLTNVRLAIKPSRIHLPVYLAAIGPQALRLAGRVADGVLLNAYVPTSYIEFAVTEIKTAARLAGRDPDAIDIACMLVVRPTNDPAAMMPALKERMVRLLVEPHVGEILLEKGGFDPGILGPLRRTAEREGEKAATGLITEEMVESFYVLGSFERCRERIAAYRNAGVDRPLLLPRLEDYEKVARTLGKT